MISQWMRVWLEIFLSALCNSYHDVIRFDVLVHDVFTVKMMQPCAHATDNGRSDSRSQL